VTASALGDALGMVDGRFPQVCTIPADCRPF
jgi:hypothetical protein